MSHLPYGIEYDGIVNYIKENWDGKDMNGKELNKNEVLYVNSNSIGKYYETDKEKSIWQEYKINGIYGLAGNLSEISRERNGEEIVLRGGTWAVTGSQEPLASKISVKEAEMDILKNENEEEIKLGSVGIRAAMYIKTEYEGNNELEKAKKEAIEEIEKYAKEKAKEAEGKEVETKGTVYESIVEYVKYRINELTSSRSIEKIKAYGKQLIDQVSLYIKDAVVELMEREKKNEIY